MLGFMKVLVLGVTTLTPKGPRQFSYQKLLKTIISIA